MNLLRVNSNQTLQHLVTHFILIEKEKFTVSSITEKVCGSELFNNFCNKEIVSQMVANTIGTFLNYGKLDVCDHQYFNV